MQLGAEGGQLAQALGVLGGAFIGDIVGGAGESIDIGHGAAQPPRQQQRSNGEILVVIDGHTDSGAGRHQPPE